MADGEKMETVTDFFSWAPESLQIMTVAMQLKDACSLERKLCLLFCFAYKVIITIFLNSVYIR